MIRHSPLALLLPALFLALGALFPKTASAAESCSTATCHASLLKQKNVHAVAESCDSCHQASTTPHPQAGKKTFQLLQEPPALCERCHPPMAKKKHPHAPVEGGMCTTCHNPHSSPEPKLLPQPMKDLCLQCHPGKTDHTYVHGPAATGDCTSCHSPHGAELKALLVKKNEELCYLCHVDMQPEMQRKYVHPALQGGCTSCHDPHGSPSKKLLAAEGEQVCFRCHARVGEVLQKAKSIHPPVKSQKGCASCHMPHSSDGPKLLLKTGKDLCLECHPQVIAKEQTVLHGPIQKETCTPCHDPHGSPNGKLLKGTFPDNFYIAYDDKQYGLCFTCHNRDLLKFPTTSYATGFRDGDRNLHHLHVNKKDKGRSCQSCHLVHASEAPKLIADKVLFGKWKLPLRYVKTDTGGSCSPGCHKQFHYDRKTPGKAPEPADAALKEKKKPRK